MATLSFMPINYPEIKRRREEKLTLGEAAQRASEWLKRSGHPVKITQQRFSDIESGRFADPRFSTIEAVCYALGCSIDDIRQVPAGKARR